VTVLGILGATTSRKVRVCVLLDSMARTLTRHLLSCVGSGDVTRYGYMLGLDFPTVYTNLSAQHDIYT
jgi:hypothetical protein